MRKPTLINRAMMTWEIFLVLFVFCPYESSGSTRPANEWSPHVVKQGDGKGGIVFLPAKYQLMYKPGGLSTYPFGIAQMDNGEVAMVCSWKMPDKREVPVIAFSKDYGETWSEFKRIPNAGGRPMMLTYLGNGVLTGTAMITAGHGKVSGDKVQAMAGCSVLKVTTGSIVTRTELR